MIHIKTLSLIAVLACFFGLTTLHCIGAPSVGYTNWVARHAVLGRFDEDDDSDGQNNLLEYALDGDPQDSTEKGVVPLYRIHEEQIEFTYVKRNDDPDLKYQIETSTDLITWETNGTLSASFKGDTYDAVTETIPCSEQKLFLRLKVIMHNSAVVIAPVLTEAEDYERQSGVRKTGSRWDGEVISDITDGDWVEYTVNIPRKGLYYAEFRVASTESKFSKAGQIDVYEGDNLLGSVSFNGTGAVHAYKTFRSTVLFPSAGEKTLRLEFSDGGFRLAHFNFNYARFYDPSAIRVQAEDYIAQSRTNVQDANEDEGGGSCIGSFESQDWVEYAVTVPRSGVYELLMRVGVNNKSTIEMAVNNDDIISPIAAATVYPNGNGTTWKTISTTVNIPWPGPRTFRATSKGNGLFFNWFQIKFLRPFDKTPSRKGLEGFAYLVKDHKSYLFSDKNTTAYGANEPTYQAGGYQFNDARMALLSADKTDQLMDITGSYTAYERKAGMGLSAFIVYRTPATMPSGTKYLLSNGDASRDGFSMAINANNRLQVSMGGGAWLVDDSAVLQPNTTYVLVATYNAHVDKLSVYNTQGDSILESPAVPLDYATGLPLLLGGKNAENIRADGTYYEVRLYDRVVSTLQIEDESAMLLSKWKATATLQQHLTAEDLSDFVLEGNAIKQWIDRSGNKENARPNTRVVEFVASTTLIEKARGVHFQGDAATLLLADETEQDKWLNFSSNGNEGLTVVLAFNPKTMAPNGHDIMGNTEFSLGVSGSAKPVASLGGTLLQAANSLSVDVPAIYTLRYDATAKTVELWNAGNKETVRATLAPSDFSAASPVLLGKANSSLRDFDGDVYELKVYTSALPDEALAYQQQMAIRKWTPAVRPVEVIGHEGYITDRYIYLDKDSANKATDLWLQVNNLAYQNKGSIKINDDEWVDLNHKTVGMHAPEKAAGGMTHGGYNTIRFKRSTLAFKPGLNRIQFRFNEADGISMGYRIVNMKVLDASGSNLLKEHQIIDDDPNTWVGPYTDEESIKEGRLIWYERTSWPPTEENRFPEGMVSNYKAEGVEGFWYDYALPAPGMMHAACTDCHLDDGRDMEMFSVSNYVLIEGVKSHHMSRHHGELLASYIRSLKDKHENIDRVGRPWTPVYQPGPKVAEAPVKHWYAAGGLESVLDKDSEMVPAMFGNKPGVTPTQEQVDAYFDKNGAFDSTTNAVALQFPDWHHWLPKLHPIDSMKYGDWFTGVQSNPRDRLKSFREKLEKIPLDEMEARTYCKENRESIFKGVNGVMRGFRDWTWYHEENKGQPTNNLCFTADGLPIDLAEMSLSKLQGAKQFGNYNEFNLQDKLYYATSEEDRKKYDFPLRYWFTGSFYHVFEVAPHFNVRGTKIYRGVTIPHQYANYYGQEKRTGYYESTMWYELQAVLTPGNMYSNMSQPIHYTYQFPWIAHSSSHTRRINGMRFFMTANRVRQVHMDHDNYSMKNMGPHLIDNLDFGFLRSADDDYPGLSEKILIGYLRNFNKDMKEGTYYGGSWGEESYKMLSNVSNEKWSDEAMVEIKSTQEWFEPQWPNYPWGSLFDWGWINPEPSGNPNNTSDPIIIQAENFTNRDAVSKEGNKEAGIDQYVYKPGDEGWMQYNAVHIPAAGRYTVELRVAIEERGSDKGVLELLTYTKNPNSSEFTPLNTVSLNSTGTKNNPNWITSTMQVVFPEAGYQTLRLELKEAPININWISLKYVGL